MLDRSQLARPHDIGALLKQGNVWSSQYAEVVAAALEIALDREAADGPGVLDTLRHAAVGWKIEEELAHPYDEAWASHELLPTMRLADVHGTLAERLPRLLERLADPSADVRRELARLVTVMPEMRHAVVPALEAAVVEEKDALARLAMLFALARLGAPRVIEGVRSNPVLDAAAGLVKIVSGGPLDGATELIASMRKLGGLGNVVRGFPGGDSIVRASAAAIVAEIMRREDWATLDRLGGDGQLAECVAMALWPFASAPPEPRTTLSAHERSWLVTITKKNWAGAITPTVTPTTLVRCGFVPGPHAARLLGKADPGSADAIVATGTPAWLLARRVSDARMPMTAWDDAMKELAPEAIVAIVDDLRSYALDRAWPTTTLPHDTVPDLDARERFYALARRAYAHVPHAALERFLDGPAKPVDATALASLVDRGVAIPTSAEARLAELVAPFSLAIAESDWDVEGLRTAFTSLPPERRAAALASAVPGVVIDPWNDAARLTGLWRFVRILPPDLFLKLARHLVELSALTALSKPKTEKEHAMKMALLGEIERSARAAGEPFVEAPRAAIAAKPKKAAYAVLEHALAARGAPLEAEKARSKKGSSRAPN